MIELPPDASSPARARRFVERVLHACPARVVESASLLVTELVTNVVLHARTTMRVSVEARDELVLVRVEDRSAVQPSMRHYDDDAATGRGLRIVERVARAWGVDDHADGKTVWFELDAADAPRGLSGSRRG